MLVFSYAVELDAADANAETYAELVREAVTAYRSRAACYNTTGDTAAAGRDRKRADVLEAKLKKPGDDKQASPDASRLPGKVVIANDWADPVTVVIAGISYTLPAGGTKTLPSPTGSFPYEMLAGAHKVTGMIEAGKTYRVKPPQ
jgi:hypothetical protein